MKELIPRLIKAEKLYGGPHSEILSLCIPILSKVTDSPLPFKRFQFSIILAYYLKLNNAHGQSLVRAGIYLPKNVFSQYLVIQDVSIPILCYFIRNRVYLTVKKIFDGRQDIHMQYCLSRISSQIITTY